MRGLSFRDARGSEFFWDLSFRDTRVSEFSTHPLPARVPQRCAPYITRTPAMQGNLPLSQR